MKLLLLFSIVFLCTIHSKKIKVFLDEERNIQNMLIYINNNVDENGGKLLKSIITQVKAASQSLFKATKVIGKSKSGIKFGSIFISVPNRWKVKGDMSTWQEQERANFKVVNIQDNKYSEKPETKQLKKCGQPGEYSLFPVEFFGKGVKRKSNILRNGKEIMREFVKLRYGVFSEEPYKNILIVQNGSELADGTCSKDINWKIKEPTIKCTDKNYECKYVIEENQSHDYSVMFDIETASSEYFCDDESRPHNSIAYNLQNIVCKGKSIGAVLKKHKDFKSKIKKNYKYVDPVFHIVKQNGRNVVFILDISGSMCNAMKKIISGVTKAITQIIEPTAQVGIAAFNNEAKTIAPLTIINTEENTKMLIDGIKNISCVGFSNIAQGLQEGMNILLNSQRTREYGSMILISDEENFGDTVSDYKKAFKAIKASGVVFNVISMSNQSDSNFNKLSNKTKGKYEYISSLDDFTQVLNRILIWDDQTQTGNFKSKAKRGKIVVSSSSRKFKFKYLDKFTEDYTLINVNFTKDTSKYEVNLIDPEGNEITNKTKTIHHETTMYVFTIFGQALSGKYKLKYIKKPKERVKRSVHWDSITNKQLSCSHTQQSETHIDRVNETSSITVTWDLSNCPFEYQKCRSIILVITSPRNQTTIKSLMDSGLGEDKIKDDKIFTKKLFYKDLTDEGIYSLNGFLETSPSNSIDQEIYTVHFGDLLVKEVGKLPISDKIPPAKMSKLHIKKKYNEKKIVIFSTTATGDDSMDGNISRYDILIRSSTDHILHLTEKKSPTQYMEFSLDLSKINVPNVFQIAIRGQDASFNVGEWSEMTIVNFNKN